MRIAVISDVHGNLEALKEVFNKINKERPQLIIFLGDAVGFGPDPNEVCNLLRTKENLTGVIGDYDKALITGDLRGFDFVSRKCIEWTKRQITDVNLKFLESLKEFQGKRIENLNVFLVHGSPRNYLNGYVYEDDPEEDFKKYFEVTNADIILAGHTHLPFVKKIDEKIFINPGSIGQPRGGDNRASFAILNIFENKVEFKIEKVKYKVEKTTEKIRKVGLPKEIAIRIKEGW
jgi:putative phosphoesterase